MEIFLSTLNQLAFLFSLIVAGYVISKLKVVGSSAAGTLSKLENTLFIPALVLGTFIDNFTVESLSSAWKILLISFLVAIVFIILSIITSRLITKDRYMRNIYTYALSFSNFGFMGNAVVSALFPEIFFEYLIFTLPLWSLIYLWGAPTLLIADPNKKMGLKDGIKAFINPMFISVIIGMVIGISGIKLPPFIDQAISSASACMSPVAMLITGIVVSEISLKSAFSNIKTYIVSVVRLIVYPFLFIAAAQFIDIPQNVFICILSSLAMPLGLNTIVIPSGLGRDTTQAAGMAVVSHLLSCITIPIIFSFIPV